MKSELLSQYRQLLLEAGMKEPTRPIFAGKHLFYRQETSLTAFVVNLQEIEDGIRVTYGFSSTAFTLCKGDEESLSRFGISDEDIRLRQRLEIRTPDEEQAAQAAIRAMYDTYHLTEKDDLLALAREKQKAFIKTIAVRLKPLGFKKKGNTWTRDLEDNYVLSFYAQKSSFSDEFYFNLSIDAKDSTVFGSCYYTRVAPAEMYPMDWQCIPEAVWTAFLDDLAENTLPPLINTPLGELGKQRCIWEECDCSRQKCSHCWVEQNLWEANNIKPRTWAETLDAVLYSKMEGGKP